MRIEGKVFNRAQFNNLPRTVQGRIMGRIAHNALIAARKAELEELEDEETPAVRGEIPST